MVYLLTMTVAEYYITTLSTAFGKLAPAVGFIVIGYFIFFKLPFLFLLKNMTNYKKNLQEDQRGLGELKKDYSVEDYEDFKRRMRTVKKPQSETLRLEKPQEKQRTEEKREKAKPRPQENFAASAAEKLFEIEPGRSYSKVELRKKYHDLLRQNHPDKVASLGQDFKILAEKKTKEINDAYNKLKSKAA